MREIYLAGGCFWGVEKAISLINGVVSTQCGYANGDPHLIPDYLLVCSGKFGYAEAVKVSYDPEVLPLEKLLRGFFMIIDPCSLNKQGNDRGIQYRTGIYWIDDDSERIVSGIVSDMSANLPGFCTEAGPLLNFTPAEPYHQGYLDRNPGGYCHISVREMEELSRM